MDLSLYGEISIMRICNFNAARAAIPSAAGCVVSLGSLGFARDSLLKFVWLLLLLRGCVYVCLLGGKGGGSVV